MEKSEKYAVIFDMDGTIIDNEYMNVQHISKFFSDRKLIYNEESIQMSLGAKGGVWEAVRKYNPGADVERLQIELRAYLDENPYDYKRIMRPNMKVLLKEIKEEGMKVGVASSSLMDKVLFVLDECGILKEFDDIVTGDMVKISKPDPEIYLMACERLGLNPADCICIEDSANGVNSAKSAGMKAIALTDRHFGQDLKNADKITDFSEINIGMIKSILYTDTVS